MYNINLQHLKVISEIEKQGSMTKAADALFLTQSALSHHVKELEKNLGITVFERRNKKLWLTEVGQQLLASADVIKAELGKLEDKISRLKTGNTGIIRISTECYTTYSWLPKLVKRFNEKHPKLAIKVVTEATANTMQFLQNGQLDIAITSREKLPDANLNYTPLFKDELMVIVHKNHQLAAFESIEPKDFEGQTLLVYDYDDKDLDILQLILKPSGVQLTELIKMPLSEIIIEMVKANFGITVMANWLAAPLLTKDLVAIPLIHAFANRTWHLVSYKNDHQGHQKFIDFAVKNLRNK
jgi:LysR family transcriptional regulator, regulator for metE and metH